MCGLFDVYSGRLIHTNHRERTVPTEQDIHSQRERLYESSSLRDDINDTEATYLLQWGENQVQRLANTVPDEDFEQQCRFLRQLIKSVNRFVGQREFNDRAGQLEYLEKVVKWLPRVQGMRPTSADALLNTLPETAHMMTDLKIILEQITPESSQNPDQTVSSPIDKNKPDSNPGEQ